MLLFPRVGLVVEDVEVAVADLQEVDVTGDDIYVEIQVEASITEIPDVATGQINWNLHGHGHRIVDQQKTLERLVSLLVVRRGRQHELGQSRCVVLLAFYWRTRRITAIITSVTTALRRRLSPSDPVETVNLRFG